jgi:3-methyl-2-oxobutanoate hydroxymethyltransferase
MGHIGLTPQTASALGGFKIQGRDASAAKQIVDDARALEDAGVFSMILEAVPSPLGQLIAESVEVPVIGIGAGPDVDGQVLVFHDVVGLYDRFVPKFVKQYAKVRAVMLDALNEYKQEVMAVKFPGPEHSFKMPDDALEQLKNLVSE